MTVCMCRDIHTLQPYIIISLIHLPLKPHIENQVRHPHKTGKCFNVTTMQIEATCPPPKRPCARN